jgi:hypothetical protein
MMNRPSSEASMMRSTVAVVGLLLLLPMCEATSQVGLTAGTEYGFGAYGRVGSRVAVEGGVGFVPLLALNLTVAEDTKIYFPLSIGAKLSIPVSKPDATTPIGVKFGVTHNAILKTGFGAGITAKVGQRLIIGGAIMYFPKAQEGLTDQVNKDNNSNYSTVIGESIAIQPVVSVSFLLGQRRGEPAK